MATSFGKRGLSDPSAKGGKEDGGQEWYVKLSGDICGPYSVSALKELKDRGVLGAQTLICGSHFGPWSTALSNHGVRHIFTANQQTSLWDKPRQSAEPFRKIFIFGQISSGVNYDFERILSTLGVWTLVMQNCWALKTRHPIAYVRNAITPVLAYNDGILISDSTAGTTVSHNIGLEAEVKLKNLWA